jgi:hypothetical protein
MSILSHPSRKSAASPGAVRAWTAVGGLAAALFLLANRRRARIALAAPAR